MKSYKIKTLQFQILPVLLETTQAEMSARLGKNPNYVCRHLQDCEFKLYDVIALCNSYHLPFSLFVTTGTDDVYAGKEVRHFTEWKDIAFSPDSVRKIMKREGVSMNMVNRTMGISRNTANSILTDECPLSRFLAFCNAFGFNMGDFISDPTLPRISDASRDMKKEAERLRKELLELRASAFALQEENTKLRAENANLRLRLKDNEYEEEITNPHQVAEE